MDNEPILIKKLSNGNYHIKGLGPCNWSTVPEWPCSEETIRECAGGEACEEFIKAAVEIVRKE